MLSLVSGNAMRNFSVLLLGLGSLHYGFYRCPTLQMDILPKFVEWGKQGEVGRRNLKSSYSLYCSLVLAFVQSIGITAGFNTLAGAQLLKNSSYSTSPYL